MVKDGSGSGGGRRRSCRTARGTSPWMVGKQLLLGMIVDSVKAWLRTSMAAVEASRSRREGRHDLPGRYYINVGLRWTTASKIRTDPAILQIDVFFRKHLRASALFERNSWSASQSAWSGHKRRNDRSYPPWSKITKKGFSIGSLECHISPE